MRSLSQGGCDIEPVGDDKSISSISPLMDAGRGDISFFDNPKYKEDFSSTKAGACFCAPQHQSAAPSGCTLLITSTPYYAYSKTVALFYPDALIACNESGGVHPNAIIDDSAHIGEGCTIEAGAFIGPSCRIGAGSYISSGAVIRCAEIGERCIIHPGVSIGQDGFGFAFHQGAHYKVPQIGGVVIGNDVEIGAGTCIDRGAIGNTIIGDGCKIDNMVQIAHNVQLGKHCIMVSSSGIAGSSVIGDYVVIGGNAGIAGHLHIGDGAQIAGNSGVIRDIEPGAKMGGYPAVPIKQFHRQSVTLANLAGRKTRGGKKSPS